MARSGKGVLLLGGAGAVGVLLLAAAAGRHRDEAPVGSGLPFPDGGPPPSPPPAPNPAPAVPMEPAVPVSSSAVPKPPSPAARPPSPAVPAPPSPAPAPPAGDGLLETVASVPGRVADAVTDAVRDAGGALVDRMSWVPRVIARVTRHEGGYESVNPNKDGAGLSFGILQWNRATLAKLLGQMYAADPDAFRRLFGPSWAGLLQAANSGGMGTVDGAHLWQEPWLSRFRAAGRHPPFQGVQDRVARDGEHFRAAEKVARRLGVPTERALALFFDTAVQQGATAADQVAGKVKAALVGGGAPVSVPYRDLLATYAQAAANRARRATPPESSSSGRLRWVKVGVEWHLHAGKLDLYRDILSRRTAILKDPHLGDAPVRLA